MTHLEIDQELLESPNKLRERIYEFIDLSSKETLEQYYFGQKDIVEDFCERYFIEGESTAIFRERYPELRRFLEENAENSI